MGLRDMPQESFHDLIESGFIGPMQGGKAEREIGGGTSGPQTSACVVTPTDGRSAERHFEGEGGKDDLSSRGSW